MRKIYNLVQTWNDEIKPWMLKGLVQGYLLAIGKMPRYQYLTDEELDELIKQHQYQNPGRKVPAPPSGEREKVLRWIKASERLPEPDLEIHIRWGTFKETGDRYGLLRRLKDGDMDIEWLEESDQPAPSPQTEGDSEMWHPQDYSGKNAPRLEGEQVPDGSKMKNFGPEDTKELIKSVYKILDELLVVGYDKTGNEGVVGKITASQRIGYVWAGMMDAVYEGAAQWESDYNDAKKQNAILQSQLSKITEERDMYKKLLDEYGKI